MQGNKRSIEILNELLTLELTAINQYFLHQKMCESWGYAKLATKIRAISMEEMHDAEDLTARILFLEGIPNLQRLSPVKIGETVTEQLRLMMETEQAALSLLNAAVPECAESGDHATREYLAAKLAEEETHLDWLETQLGLIDSIGLQNYLTGQL